MFVDAQADYQVRVPSPHTNTSGISWATGITAGRTVALRDFFVATPSDSVHTINNQLAGGRNLLLTPGIYDVAKSISVKRADTVVLGLGQATLTAVDGAIPLTVADVPGVIVAGVTIDAGLVESPVLLQVGKKNGNSSPKKNDPSNPTTLSDVYFRVGGPHVGKADIALEVNRDNVLIDHTWVWRADHDVEGLSDTERWNTNTGRHGLVVNGDNVTATGLFVEHFQEYNTVWNGENGRTILYQNELPYDPPTQADWMHDGVEGWAGYEVANQSGDPPTRRRRCLRFQPEQPDDPYREWLRGPGDPGGAPAPRHDRQPQCRHDRPRGQRGRWPGGCQPDRFSRVRRRLPVISPAVDKRGTRHRCRTTRTPRARTCSVRRPRGRGAGLARG